MSPYCHWCAISPVRAPNAASHLSGQHDAYVHRLGQAYSLRGIAQRSGVDFNRPEWEAIGRLRDRYERKGPW
jgi:hypothetical protein